MVFFILKYIFVRAINTVFLKFNLAERVKGVFHDFSLYIHFSHHSLGRVAKHRVQLVCTDIII